MARQRRASAPATAGKTAARRIPPVRRTTPTARPPRPPPSSSRRSRELPVLAQGGGDVPRLPALLQRDAGRLRRRPADATRDVRRRAARRPGRPRRQAVRRPRRASCSTTHAGAGRRPARRGVRHQRRQAFQVRAARHAADPRQAVGPRGRRLPPLAGGGDRGGEAADDRLPRRDGRPVAAWATRSASRRAAASRSPTRSGPRG